MILQGLLLLVDAAAASAATLGIPPIVIGLTVAAVGTSLPEFIPGITSSRRNVSDLSVGNIAGANIAAVIIMAAAGVS